MLRSIRRLVILFSCTVLFAFSLGLVSGCAAVRPKSGPGADHPQAVPRGR